MVQQVNAQELKEIFAKNKYVVVDFFATWCGPCRMLSPVMEGVSEKFEGKVTFVKVDIDENESLAVQYGISSIPNVFFFENGMPKASSLGFVPAEQMLAFVQQNAKE